MFLRLSTTSSHVQDTTAVVLLFNLRIICNLAWSGGLARGDGSTYSWCMRDFGLATGALCPAPIHLAETFDSRLFKFCTFGSESNNK